LVMILHFLLLWSFFVCEPSSFWTAFSHLVNVGVDWTVSSGMSAHHIILLKSNKHLPFVLYLLPQVASSYIHNKNSFMLPYSPT
jgi:hypothetical protein